MPAGAGDHPAASAVPGVPGPMQCQVDFLSRGGQRRSSSGGFDWREVSQVAVSFACAFFSSAGKHYRSSSGFSRLWTRFSSAHFCSLLHWRRLSVVLPASAVDCCLSSLRAGVCSLLWQWRFSVRVLMVACFPRLRVGGKAQSPVPLMLVASIGFPVNHGLSQTLLWVSFQRACAGFLLPSPLGAGLTLHRLVLLFLVLSSCKNLAWLFSWGWWLVLG